jgi:hypothetical protein
VTEDREERMLFALEQIGVSFGRIADALEGLHGAAKSAGYRFWPDPRQPKEAVVSRVKSEEDIAKEEQGRLDPSLSIEDWLALGDPSEWMGERERAFREAERQRNAGAKPNSGPEGGSVEAAEGEAGATGESAADHSAS